MILTNSIGRELTVMMRESNDILVAFVGFAGFIVFLGAATAVAMVVLKLLLMFGKLIGLF